MFKSVILPRFGIFLLVTFILCIVGGILSSNIVQGDYKIKYGTVKVPGTKTLHLPSGTTNVAFAAFLPGAGNETPDMPIPKNLDLDVKPAAGSGLSLPTITRDVGGSANSSADNTNTDVRVWKVDIAQAGDYRVTAFGGSAVLLNQTLELGTGPAVPIGIVYAIAGVIGLLAALFGPAIRNRLRGGSSGGGDGTAPEFEHSAYGRVQ